MKNITLSADEALIEQARKKAQSEKSSLNKRFREWLQRYVGSYSQSDYIKLMNSMQYAEPGRSFSRDEMNER